MAKGGKIISGLFWKFCERIAAQMVTFGVSVLLARLLAPADYGLIPMVAVFVNFANVLVSSGFGNSLIQKKDADELDFSSVFFTQMGLAMLLYGVLFFSAPYVAAFYGPGYELLCPVLRVLGLRIPFAAVNNVQHAWVSRQMIFKKFFFATISGTAVSGVVGVWMAYAGWGVWALVAQYLTNTVVHTIVLNRILKWQPQMKFSFTRLKPLFSYGWKLLTVDVINSLLNELRTVLVGKFYSSADLAYYSKGEQFPSLIVTNINTSIQSVLFPAMSNRQGSVESVKALLRRMINVGSFVIFPLIFGFMAVSERVVLLLLTEKWIEAVPFVQILCAAYSLRIISTSCAQSVKALGRSDMYLKSTSIYKVIEFVSIVVSAFISVQAVAIGALINAVVLVIVQYICNRMLLGYRLREFAADLLPNALLTLTMVAAVLLVGCLSNSLWMLVVQVPVGGVVYLGGAWMFKLRPVKEILSKVKSMKA